MSETDTIIYTWIVFVQKLKVVIMTGLNAAGAVISNSRRFGSDTTAVRRITSVPDILPAPMIPGLCEYDYECLRFHGKILTGKHRVWCCEWDGLPIDETCFESFCCSCMPVEVRHDG